MGGSDLDGDAFRDWAAAAAATHAVVIRAEVQLVLGRMRGTPRLVAALPYGAGLWLQEALSLRVKDVDLGLGQIMVGCAKGEGPSSARRGARAGRVALPGALDRKYLGASVEWAWQWVFPATRRYVDRGTRECRRHHLHETVVQRAVKAAVRRSGLSKRAASHTTRHSFASHLMEDGCDIRTVQELLGPRDVSTMMIHTHVLNRGGRGVVSPMDRV